MCAVDFHLGFLWLAAFWPIIDCHFPCSSAYPSVTGASPCACAMGPPKSVGTAISLEDVHTSSWIAREAQVPAPCRSSAGEVAGRGSRSVGPLPARPWATSPTSPPTSWAVPAEITSNFDVCDELSIGRNLNFDRLGMTLRYDFFDFGALDGDGGVLRALRKGSVPAE